MLNYFVKDKEEGNIFKIADYKEIINMLVFFKHKISFKYIYNNELLIDLI